jgi:para-nitrobenzyl esterase
MGESAGATDVAALIASPMASGLFQRAILESVVGGGVLPTLAEHERRTGTTVAQAAGCEPGPEPLADSAVAACLRSLTAAQVVSAVPGQIDVLPRIYGPIVDGRVVPAQPLSRIQMAGLPTGVPTILGSDANETATQVLSPRAGAVSDEASYQVALAKVFGAEDATAISTRYPSSAFPSQRAAFIAATTDGLHLCPSRRLARALVGAQARPLYRFLYTHAFDNDPALGAQGAVHGYELPFVFHFSGAAYRPTAAELALSDQMIGYWARFAATGDPNGDGALPWPSFEPAAEQHLEMDTPIRSSERIHESLCDFWDTL